MITFQSTINLETCGSIEKTLTDLIAVVDQRRGGNDDLCRSVHKSSIGKEERTKNFM